jgi:hypothetical protein
MKSIRDLYKEMNVEETVNSYSHKVKAQSRWARLKMRKQAEKVEEILNKPQDSLRKLTDDLQHDMTALKSFYETQKREISKLGKTLRKNKDKFFEKSKVFGKTETAEARKEKIVGDSEVA